MGFFIAALLALTRPFMVVFAGCWGALAFMTVLSALIGVLVPTLLSPVVSHYLSVALFLNFGLRASYQAAVMYKTGTGIGASEELQETEGELNNDKNLKANSRGLGLIVTIFTMTFVAEWGDKSQVATIAMGGSRSVLGVILGAVIGHAFCTGLAIWGGKMMSTKISERQVPLVSGLLFSLFAIRGLWTGVEEASTS